MIDQLRQFLESDDRLAYALVFGSVARDKARPDSDLDVAIGLPQGKTLSVREIGELASGLESVAGRPVDLVLLDEASPAVAYRIFRDGILVAVRDRAALVERKARAILEYLDFRPIEELCARGALAAARDRQSSTG